MTSVPLFELPERTPCCACGAFERTELHRKTYPAHPGPFRLTECVRCGLLLNSPRLADPSVLYQSAYYVFGEREAWRQRAAFSQLTWVREMLEVETLEGLTIAEVGSAMGHLTSLAERDGATMIAAELSEHAAAKSRERFGLDVFQGTVEELAARRSATDGVDAVWAFEVIEHVTDPRGFAKACLELLRPGGRLCLSTPNAAAEGRARRGKGWGGFNPFHIVLFTPDSMKLLLEAVGFRDVKIETTAAADGSTFGSRLPGKLRTILVDTLDTVGLGALSRALRARFERPEPEATPIEDVDLEEGRVRYEIPFSGHWLGDTLRVTARR